ncbi:MAG: flavodoxin family protein [Spirochaetaceae bacterium]|jgi:multimeric flavodoxin WrbA|nr:flavodoxin family protein [Spirochaetaceae bacterium]
MQDTFQNEKKQALVLMGSPRRNGATAELVRCFTDLWQSRRHEYTVIEAYQAAVKPCVHCGYCKRALACRYDDDFSLIDRGFREADLLVVASPVYGLGFPGPLKAVFDRTQRYFEAKFSLGVEHPIEKHKTALLLAAYGSKSSRGVELMEEHLRLMFLLLNASLKGTITAPNTDSIPVDSHRVAGELKLFLNF